MKNYAKVLMLLGVVSLLSSCAYKTAETGDKQPATIQAVIIPQDASERSNLDEKMMTLGDAVIAEVVKPPETSSDTAIEKNVDILLKAGDNGEKVVNLQKKLYCIGYEIAVDGDFGNNTSETLKAFQRSKSLSVTGCLDVKTDEILQSAKDTRAYPPPQLKVEVKPTTVSPSGFSTIPDIKTSPGDAQQAVVILSQSYGTINANFKTYEKVNGLWQPVNNGNAVIGINGFSDNRHEGDLTTPTGKYGIPFLFGTAGNPGVKMSYRQAVFGDYWVSNKIPEEYNVWMHYEGADPKARFYDYEKLWTQLLYKYAAFIDFNYGPNKIMGKGSAIFLHIAPPSGGGTEGCIGVSETNLLRILRWLDPAKRPAVIMGVKGRI